MKKRLLLLSCLLGTFSMFGQAPFWHQLPGPYGGEIQSFGSNQDGVLFALLKEESLFRSLDNGLSWEEVPNFPSDDSNSKVIISSDDRLYVKDGFTIHVSEDNGDSWAPLGPVIPGLQEFIALPSGTFIASRINAILRSVDGGQSWDTVDEDLDFVINELRYDPYSERIFAFNNSEGQIFVSTDDGLNWSALLTTAMEEIYDVAGSENGGIWFLAEDKIWYSSDNGANWEASSALPGNAEIFEGQIVATSSGRVWIRQGSWGFYTDSNGLSWEGNGFSASRIFGLDDGSLWLSRFTRGLYRMNENDLIAEFRGMGLNHPEVKSLKFNEQGHAFAMTPAGLFQSVDNLENWDLLFEPPSSGGGPGFDIEMNAQGHIYVLYYGRLFRSTDGGGVFVHVQSPEGPVEDGENHSIFLHPNGDLFLSAINGLYRSSNGGDNWELAHSGWFNQSLALHPDGSLYLQQSNDLFRSDDDGQTWTNIFSQGPPFNIYAFHLAQDGSIYVGDSEGMVHRSGDEGQTWNASSLPSQFSYPVHDIETNVEGHVFVINNFSPTIFLSVDQGVSWSTMPHYETNGSGTDYDQIFVPSDQHIYTGSSDHGFFRSTFPTTEATYLAGDLRLSDPNDCLPDDGDAFAAGWLIEAEGPIDQYARTNSEGEFQLIAVPGTYYYRAIPPSPYWEACVQEFIIEEEDLQLDTLGPVNLVTKPIVDCAYLDVDISTGFLRRCFSNTFTVTYCNRGTAVAEDAKIEVFLDPFLILEGASFPITSQTDELITFELGDLEPRDCGSIYIYFTVSCEAELGVEHCVTASITPMELCLPDVESLTVSRHCQTNIGAFDPNDKRAFVDGRISDDYLPPGEPLSYQIRFQNTGTDTAFNIVILDTLDAALDLSAFRPGASSHPYEFDILADRVLQFSFENIMLPDSNINEPASHGFVSFYIVPQEGLALGSGIENRAAIYFDFNEPVITNTVQLVYDNVTAPPPLPKLQQQLVEVYPNPFGETTTFEVQTTDFQTLILQIFTADGRRVRAEIYRESPFQLSKDQLPAGLYWYKVLADNEILGTGKLVIR